MADPADPDAPDVELLADLDAGLLPADRAADVRRGASSDPRASAVLDALAATRADLAALPAPSAPPDLVRRWTATLAAAPPPAGAPPGGPAVAGPSPHRSAPGPGRGPGRGRPARPRPRAARRGALAATAVAVLALVTGLFAARAAGPLDVGRVELAAVARSTVGLTDLGALADPARRDACLRAAGVTGATVLGGRQVRLDGTPGVLLVLPTGELGSFRVLVVTPACRVLSDGTVGGR